MFSSPTGHIDIGERLRRGIATLVLNRQVMQLCIKAHMHYVLRNLPLKGLVTHVQALRLMLLGL